VGDGGALQDARSLRKFREKLVALENQRADLDKAIAELREGITSVERRLAQTRPDLLPRAADYDQMLRQHLDGVEPA